MTTARIDGEDIARHVLVGVARGTASLRAERGVTPGLAIVLLGDGSAQARYAQKKLDAAAGVGVLAQCFNLPWDVPEETLRALLRDLGRDSRFHGLFLQLPLPGHIDLRVVSETIEAGKDVDCMSPLSMGRLLAASDSFLPAAVAAAREVLLRSEVGVAGRHVVICSGAGASTNWTLLAPVLLSDGCASVTLCNPATPGLGEVTGRADILVVEIGMPLFIQPGMVKPRAVVIDGGQNVVRTGNEGRATWRSVGDVDFDGVSRKALAVSPVPGGIGPVVVAMLLSNTLEAARRLTSPGAVSGTGTG